MNQLQITGILGKDALLNTHAGKDLLNFSVAVSDDYKDDKGEWQKRTIWYECTIWNSNQVDRFKKGTLVFIQGTPRLNLYSKQDGTQGASIKISVVKAEVLRKGDGSTPGNTAAASQPAAPAAASTFNEMPSQEIADDLPF